MRLAPTATLRQKLPKPPCKQEGNIRDTGSTDHRRILASAGSPAAPALASSGMEMQAQEGYVSLFDGRTRAGWVIEEGPESSFCVRSEAVVSHASARVSQQYSRPNNSRWPTVNLSWGSHHTCL